MEDLDLQDRAVGGDEVMGIGSLDVEGSVLLFCMGWRFRRVGFLVALCAHPLMGVVAVGRRSVPALCVVGGLVWLAIEKGLTEGCVGIAFVTFDLAFRLLGLVVEAWMVRPCWRSTESLWGSFGNDCLACCPAVVTLTVAKYELMGLVLFAAAVDDLIWRGLLVINFLG